MQTGQRGGEFGEGDSDDRQIPEGHPGSELDSAESDVIFGIVSVGSHDTIGSGGRKCGHMMEIVDLEGRKYFVGVSEKTYADLVGIYAVANQLHQDVSMSCSQPVVTQSPAVIGADPTGTPDEVERMRELLSEVDVMKKLGFISDDVMQQQQTEVVNDPVEDILSMASSEEEYEEEYEDPGESDFEEDMEGI
jgi:hypothetical protein